MEVGGDRILLSAAIEFVAEWIRENRLETFWEIVGADVEVVAEAA